MNSNAICLNLFLTIILTIMAPNCVLAQWILVRDAGYGYGYPSPYGGYYASNSCVDRRPDCRLFEYICDHPDYKSYMEGCCKNTCDPECRRKDPNDADWEARRRHQREQQGLDQNWKDQAGTGTRSTWPYRDTERDIERERRNNEAIRRKYLGENDRNNFGDGRNWDWTGTANQALFPSRSVYPGPSSLGQTAYRTSDLSKWREDNRWDRNDPSLPRGQ